MSESGDSFNRLEKRAVLGLAGIYAVRMLGLFLVLPVFVLYAGTLPGQTAFLVGLALGAYGLTQALFQIPLGALSDRIGRKPVIAGGLLIFALGSVVAALADSIWGIILGRALQGAGAVAAAIMALASDLTRDEQRTKAMALIGVTIGASFIVGLIFGPVLAQHFGLDGLFWITAVGAGLGIVVLYSVVPSAKRGTRSRHVRWSDLSDVLASPLLMQLNVGIFVLHCALTAMFVAVPLILVGSMGLDKMDHWQIYVPVLVVSVLLMTPFVMVADRKDKMKPIFMGAIAVVALAQLVLYSGSHQLAGMALGLALFFTGFNFLEAALPSLVSRAAPVAMKGMAIGVYTTCQFLGVFVGGLLGGVVYGWWGIEAVFLMAFVFLLTWLLVSKNMIMPAKLTTHELSVGQQDEEAAEGMAETLGNLPGVAEAVVLAEEGVAYLKVDKKIFDPDMLKGFRASP